MRIFIHALFAMGLVLISNAQAQVKHIVIDMDETLVRQIPKSLRTTYSPSSLVSAQDGYNKLYVKMPHVAEAFMRLQQENSFIVHFLTNKSRQWAQTILESFVLMKPFEESIMLHFGANTVNKIFSEQDLDQGVFKLESVTSDKDNVLVVTNNLSYFGGKDSPHRISLPKTLYHYNSFEDAQDARKSFLKQGSLETHESFLPKSKEQWRNEHYKIAGLVSKFITYNLFAAEKALELAPAINNSDIDAATQIGLKLSENRFERFEKRWIYGHNKEWVEGCEQADILGEIPSRILDGDQCVKELGSLKMFDLDHKTFTSGKCFLADAQYKAKIKEIPVKECEEKEEISYYWTEVNGKKTCSAFVQEVFFHRPALEQNKCFLFSYAFVEGAPSIQVDFDEIGWGNPQALPNELLTLKLGEEVSAQVYKTYDVNSIALGLVARKHRQNETFMESGYHYDYYRDTEIMMAFDAKLTGSIINKGFLNQHQIGKSNGCLCQHLRRGLEDGLIGVQLEPASEEVAAKVNKVRPKYAFLILNKASEETGYTKITKGYGNIYAVYKNKTKVRSTFTLGDSLNIDADYMDTRTFFYRSPIPLHLSPNRSAHYFEAQIWGEASIEKDVDHFLVNCPHVPNTNNQTIKLLKDTGKPVFQCHARNHNGNPYLLYKGARL